MYINSVATFIDINIKHNMCNIPLKYYTSQECCNLKRIRKYKNILKKGCQQFNNFYIQKFEN